MVELKHLNKILRKGREYHVEYGSKLANHLPMALIALYKMGANEDQLDSFHNQYLTKLVLLSKNEGNISDSFAQKGILTFLGDSRKFTSYLSFFNNDIDKFGYSETLKKYLPVLLPGLCASAFHALIRLAYGVEMEDRDEIAFALAFWASEYHSLGEISKTVDKHLLEILTEMAPITKEHEFGKGLIVDRMVEISKLPAFKKAKIQPNEIKLKDIAYLAINAFLGTSSFS